MQLAYDTLLKLNSVSKMEMNFFLPVCALSRRAQKSDWCLLQRIHADIRYEK